MVQAPVGFRIIASGSEFEARVEEVVRSIPPGAVAAYSAVAERPADPAPRAPWGPSWREARAFRGTAS